MKPLMLLLSFAALVGCSGSTDCTVTEGTGLFEIFKTEGCFVSDSTIQPENGANLSFSHGGNTVLVDGLDSISLNLVGRLYVGRRGLCTMGDEDASQPTRLEGHCDYFIRDFTKVSETESHFTLELVDVYLEAYGNKGTLKAVMDVQSFDQGFGP